MTSLPTKSIERLNRESPIPLYYQLKEMLRSWITAGKFDTGGQFPPERELVEKYGVSRMTVRRALSELVNEGLLALYLGQGIGAGVIVNGKLWRGFHGRAGEIGKWVPISNGRNEIFESYFNRPKPSKKLRRSYQC